jgi:magnesium transporter
MRTLFSSITKEPGLPAGSLVHVGEKCPTAVRITLIDYDEAHYEEKVIESVSEAFPFKDTPSVTWINVDGICDAKVVGELGSHFGIHPLVLEDIMHASQRPKAEDFGTYAYVVLRMLNMNSQVEEEQLSLIVGERFVITFQEEAGDSFDPIREQIRSGKGRIRKMGADYLAYSLIDVIVDYYFEVLEAIGEKIEDVEDDLLARPTRETLKAIHDLKREMIFLRKMVWPLREVISRLERGESPLFKQTTLIYLRDVYDHTIQVIDTIEGYRDTLSGMLDIYLSSISNRLNEVMKVLTIIATIFIPLTFIAGVYGMNFKFMPELEWRYGYFVVLGFMFAVAFAMLAVFKKRKWL